MQDMELVLNHYNPNDRENPTIVYSNRLEYFTFEHRIRLNHQMVFSEYTENENINTN